MAEHLLCQISSQAEELLNNYDENAGLAARAPDTNEIASQPLS